MRMKLDDIDLITRSDEDGVIKEIRNIVNLSVSGKRKIVELKIPGSDSNVFQDLGRNPVRISVEGSLVGPDARTTLGELKAKFGLGKPIPFSSDISPVDDVSEVVIEDFSATFRNTAPSGCRYTMVLREHPPEKGPGETKPPSQEPKAAEEVRQRVGKIADDLKKVPG